MRTKCSIFGTAMKFQKHGQDTRKEFDAFDFVGEGIDERDFFQNFFNSMDGEQTPTGEISQLVELSVKQRDQIGADDQSVRAGLIGSGLFFEIENRIGGSNRAGRSGENSQNIGAILNAGTIANQSKVGMKRRKTSFGRMNQTDVKVQVEST